MIRIVEAIGCIVVALFVGGGAAVAQTEGIEGMMAVGEMTVVGGAMAVLV